MEFNSSLTKNLVNNPILENDSNYDSQNNIKAQSIQMPETFDIKILTPSKIGNTYAFCYREFNPIFIIGPSC